MRFRFFLSALALLLGGWSLSAQTNWNMTLLSNVPYAEGCNDIWGYVDTFGTEYAILGTRKATAIINLADPTNPVEVAYIPGSTSTWRDMKNWGHFAYVTADAGNDGLLIIDLSGLPDTVSYRYWKPELTINGTTAILERCHNLYIDEYGYAYLSGCMPFNNGGELIFDVHSTPGFPTLVGKVPPVYSHDNYTRGDTLYSSNLTDGLFIIDVSDKEDPIVLANQKTSLNFTHNAWASDDGHYVFTTDERSNAFMDAYDISDFNNIRMTDRFQPIDTRNTGVIPHNTHYFQGYNVVSWYTDGVIVIDSHKPDNLVQVANYDTYTGTQTGFQGCWGAYPYLPSGRLLASDINTCLWVFDVQYTRAAYLEGIVIDAVTKQPIQGATLVIQAGQPNERVSGPDGTFKTGSNQDGLLPVLVERAGYFPRNVTFAFTAGEVLDVTIEMDPFATTSVSGLVVDKADQSPVGGAGVHYASQIDPNLTYLSYANGSGAYTLDGIVLGGHALVAGAWGYNYTEESTTLSGPATPLIELDKAYRDDFFFDYGWTVSGTAPRGQWERGIPEPTVLGNLPMNPGSALPSALGESCYVTGLAAGGGSGDHDLDDGDSRLLSPEMLLGDYENPVIHYHYWFVNAGGNTTPNDTLKVYLIKDGQETLVRAYNQSTFAWVADSLVIADWYADWSSLHIRFDAKDLPGSGHIVECGLDAFHVVDRPTTSTQAPEAPKNVFQIRPNPFRDAFQVSSPEGFPSEPVLYRIVNENGKALSSGSLQPDQTFGQSWPSGIYFLHLQWGSQQQVMKVVKAEQ